MSCQHRPSAASTQLSTRTEIAGRLHGLLVRLDDRLPGKDVALVAEFIDAAGLGLARE